MTRPGSPQEIQSALARVLPFVENPARYIGGEGNRVRKDPTLVDGRIALVFPDTYEIGMSNNALRVLYHIANSDDRFAAERAFAPWPDMGTRMRESGIPLYTLESFTPVRDFDLVGISVQTELNYTNIPYVLGLAGIPLWSRDRAEDDPFIVGGGPCMANPEPVAPFFDIFVIGDGELLLRELLERVPAGRRAGKSRRAILEELAALPGLYVPELLPVEQSPHGEWVPVQAGSNGSYQNARQVRRVWIETLRREDYPVRNCVPNTDVVHDRFAVEVTRGCTQGCRFCQAGYWYRPNRELGPDAVIDVAKQGLAASGESELGLLSLSTADYSAIDELADELISDPAFANVNLSLPSLRANSFGQELARRVAGAGGSRTATFAPETGSARLRRVINKTISDEDMYAAAEGVFANGWHSIKLYTMIGLPTENMDDMEAFCGLISKLAAIGIRHTRRALVHAKIGILVPKPFTPMQWEPFAGREEIEQRIRFVRERFRRHRNVRISWSAWDTSFIEAVLARGDRSLAPLIADASRRGVLFESHDEFFSLAKWQEVFDAHGFDTGRVFRARDLDEVLPWDFIHAGTTKGYLKLERRKMFEPESAPVPDCKWGDCQRCGIPGNYADIKLARPVAVSPAQGTASSLDAPSPSETVPPAAAARSAPDPTAPRTPDIFAASPPGPLPASTAEAIASAATADQPAAAQASSDDPATATDPDTACGSREAASRPGTRPDPRPARRRGGNERGLPYLLSFAKTDFARFLSHHGTMGLLEKAMRRAGLRLWHSTGFNPRPRFHSRGALPVGLATRREDMLVELEAPPVGDCAALIPTIEASLPDGLRILRFERATHADLPRQESETYVLAIAELGPERSALPDHGLAAFSARSLGAIVDQRGRSFELGDEIVELDLDPARGHLVLRARCNQSGATVSPFLLFAGVLGITLEEARTLHVVKSAAQG